MPVGVNDLQLRSGRVVKPKKQKQPRVIIEEKSEEETPDHSKRYVTIRPIPTHSETLQSSSNWPPYLERLVVEKNDPTPESSLASELRNICIKVPFLQAIKEIPICKKFIKEICLKKLGRKRV